MKLFVESGCCFLIFALLFTDVTASESLKPTSEDAAYVSRRTEYALRGKKIELSCIYSKNTPESSVSWRKNGEDLRPIDRVMERVSLVIERVDLEDNGVYTCHVWTGVRSVETCSISLEVLSRPYFTVEPKDVTVVDQSKSVELKCEVKGGPKPVVKWLRDDRELTDERYRVEATGTLQIRDVTVSDGGKYTCYATNAYGAESAIVRLHVAAQTGVSVVPRNRELVAGDTATFVCQAEVDKKLTWRIGWLRNGQPIDVESEPRMTHKLGNTIMKIVKANKLDSGTYTCVVSTDVDEARAQSVLVVHGEPDPPTIANVTCGSNEARVSWTISENDARSPILRYSVVYNASFAPDIWRIANDNVPAANRSYVVERLRSWADYAFRVIAWNERGPSESSAFSSGCTTLPDVPYKNPDNVEGISDDSDTIVIRWTIMRPFEQNGPGFMYRVYYKRDIPGENWTIKDIHNWRTFLLRVHDQPSYQRYKIKVIAANEKGESTESPLEVIGYSGENEPTQAPGNFTLQEIRSSTTALLAWSKVPEETVRGELRGYKIQTWSDRDGEESKREFNVEGADKTFALIEEFVPKTKNYARIRAHNGR